MRSKLRVIGGGVCVSESSGGEDGAALDPGLETLLLEREALEVGEIVEGC